ncbi:glycosyltransferase [Pleurocapsa sp. PCC 7319]|uniref:glycosyltransferase n=1 Tax=Pleurocapsa sp. PCC 7319 TaxID=118161 RepID=UPI000345CA9D|nr:glycosyltransferase [Pleurocapsa sp. PCC 7319]
MIVFTLGTIIFPFDRTVDWLDLLLKQEIITEPVVFQHGATSVARLNHPLLTAVPSFTKSEMQDLVQEASLVISHAGQGSTRMLAKMGASFVLLPRLKNYGEHVDDHQLLFAQAVEKLGIIYCTEFSDLANYIKSPPKPFEGKLFDGPSLGKYLREFYQVPVIPDKGPSSTNNLSSEFYYD